MIIGGFSFLGRLWNSRVGVSALTLKLWPGIGNFTWLSSFDEDGALSLGPSSKKKYPVNDIVTVCSSTKDGKAYNPCECSPIYKVGLKKKLHDWDSLKIHNKKWI